MFKFKLVVALLFVNMIANAADYYVNSNSSFPEPLVVTKVYMGDKMLEQKYVYPEKCYTPKKSFNLKKQIESDMTMCFTSSIQVEKKCCLGNWVRTIEKGGTMCGDGIPSKYLKGRMSFQPMDYYSSVSGDGSIKEKTSYHSIKSKKGKVTIYQEPAGAKMIKMTDAEFNEAFKKTENYWNVYLAFEKGDQFCKTKEEMRFNNYYGVSANLSKRLPHEIKNGRISSVSVSPSADDFKITVNHSKGSSSWNFTKEEFSNYFDETSKIVEVKSGIQRTIEYAGKNGNLVKFVYSEFMDNLARDAFTREFSIDLNEDNVVAFKGAVLEIIKATNSTIEYKVIRNFPVEI